MRKLALGTGLGGAVLVARWISLYWRVVSGPGDDNPVAMIFLAAAALCLVPAAGLLIALAWEEPVGWPRRLWLALSAMVMAVMTPFALMF
jgi:hypothetical protein